MEFYGFLIYMLITNYGWKIEDIKDLTIKQIKYLIMKIKGE